jgi:hypothetical protein
VESEVQLKNIRSILIWAQEERGHVNKQMFGSEFSENETFQLAFKVILKLVNCSFGNKTLTWNP